MFLDTRYYPMEYNISQQCHLPRW